MCVSFNIRYVSVWEWLPAQCVCVYVYLCTLFELILVHFLCKAMRCGVVVVGDDGGGGRQDCVIVGG